MNDSLRSLRQLIWLYFWLLLFEGALRKWFVPGLSTALLIVRDPVAVTIYAIALSRGVFPRNNFVFATGMLGLLCFAASFTGIGNLKVSLYGWRADFLHLPLIALLPRVLRQEDVRRFGRALLLMMVVEMILSVLQFQGGPTSHWNVGAGGEVGAQLFAVEGKVRASGTFSFSTGFATYLALCAAFLLYDLLAHGVYPRWLTLVAAPSLVLAVVVSASRTAVISVAIVCAMVIYIAAMKPEQFGAALRPVIVALLVVLALGKFTTLFDEGLSVHKQRFEGGGGLSEGIVKRYFQEFAAAGRALVKAPLCGLGLGVGTNAGARMLSGERQFLLGEGEWERVLMESGPILGSGFLALRAAALIMVIRAALAAYQRNHTLPLLLAGVSGTDLLTGQFGQPTALGLAVFTAGLALAAAQSETSSAPAAPALSPARDTKIRGRSRYAERLHGQGENTP